MIFSVMITLGLLGIVALCFTKAKQEKDRVDGKGSFYEVSNRKDTSRGNHGGY